MRSVVKILDHKTVIIEVVITSLLSVSGIAYDFNFARWVQSLWEKLTRYRKTCFVILDISDSVPILGTSVEYFDFYICLTKQ